MIKEGENSGSILHNFLVTLPLTCLCLLTPSITLPVTISVALPLSPFEVISIVEIGQ